MPQDDPYIATIDIGRELLDALGLSEVKGITELKIDTPAGGVASVATTQVMRRSQGDGLVRVLKRYHLVEVGSGIAPEPPPTSDTCCTQCQPFDRAHEMLVCTGGPGCLRHQEPAHG